MNLEEYNSFCASLPHTHHVVQWGGADVWKIGDKVFAIGRVEESVLAVTFKAGDLAFEILPERAGVRPAPYLASRGMKWLQHFAADGLSDDELRDHIRISYEMVIAKLTKKKRAELGMD